MKLKLDVGLRIRMRIWDLGLRIWDCGSKRLSENSPLEGGKGGVWMESDP